MRPLVTTVLCAVLVLPVGASATPAPTGLLRVASKLSGLRVRHAVPRSSLPAARYGQVVARATSRDVPPALRQTEASIYAKLGLTSPSLNVQAPRALYDAHARRLLVQRKPAAGRRALIQQYVRALVDQNYKLSRLAGLRSRDRDRWIAGEAIVDGVAALSSRLRPAAVRGTPLDRFTTLEANAGLGAGRALAAQLRYLGGRRAVATALRTFPRTTEQLLHVDKFLEREPALPVELPDHAGGAGLVVSETFGELDVRNLLLAFRVPAAGAAADGWGGGRLALYGDVAVLVLRWDDPAEAAQWQAAVPHYVAAAFPGSAARTCPPLDACWGDVAAGVYGTTSVLASGPHAADVAAALLH